MVSAQMSCLKDGCGRAVDLVSDGPGTRQWIECPVHGAIGSFGNFTEYEKTLRDFVNRFAEKKGLAGIDAQAVVQIQ